MAKEAKTKSEITKAERRQPNAIQRYFRETIGELRKVTWPTREEAWHLTKVVVIVMVLLSSFLALVDFIVSQLFGLIFKI